ncbi:WD40/YVTN/BNR-like repeat-containing protein [Noviherbaspirillum saxi]|uniref:Photosynthesis system II assembly factor Ycf48/Hcf136-like domain-containing protein n=1 Tax=Noviherbaspirillum saxi TaxID=2320863 RepID=A0A3A3FQD3_9BURK|nr:YCF48-related protein [Noviherbaspirillum saxi]RJF95672.1 hypothetical protein D3871_20030 [Noviherbaspirillum saxi]
MHTFIHHVCQATMLAVLAAHAWLPSTAAATPVTGVLERPAPRIERLHTRTYLALAPAGNRIVAVGERGLIALSDDDGKSWRQANCPVSVTLTGVAFADAHTGWAIGHSGVVLHTIDGGLTWAMQLDGVRAARIIDNSVRERGDTGGALAKVAAQLVADGPDKPFLDLQFSDARHGIVTGAYGLIFATADGGKSWQSLMHALPNPRGLHLYAVRMIGHAVWVAGEQGFLALSRDQGKTFARIETPYRGSYFTMLPTASGMVVAGLKGNAFHVAGDASDFHKVEGAPPVSFSAATALRSGGLAFANQAGQIMLSFDAGKSVTPIAVPSSGPLTALLEASDRSLVAGGVNGLARIAMSANQVDHSGNRK